MTPDQESKLFASGFHPDILTLLPTINKTPVLVLYGSESEMETVSFPHEGELHVRSELVAKLIGSGSVAKKMDGLGHMLPVEDPKRVADEIIAFLYSRVLNHNNSHL
jgi:pimeloyl-ACP methyl ester carboxylesterase